MYAVLTRVSITDYEAARKMLHSEVIPMSKQAPGFVSGCWLAPADRKSGEGVAIEVFESEEAAEAFVKQFQDQGGPPDSSLVALTSIEVREVAGRV